MRPYTGLSVSIPPPYSGQFVLPSRIAPAARIRATAVASASGTTPARSGDPIVISRPAAARLSLTVNGTPWSGPAGALRGVRGVGGGERPLGVELDDRVDGRVHRLDPPQVRLDDLARGHRAARDQVRERGGGGARELHPRYVSRSTIRIIETSSPSRVSG